MDEAAAADRTRDFGRQHRGTPIGRNHKPFRVQRWRSLRGRICIHGPSWPRFRLEAGGRISGPCRGGGACHGRQRISARSERRAHGGFHRRCALTAIVPSHQTVQAHFRQYPLHIFGRSAGRSQALEGQARGGCADGLGTLLGNLWQHHLGQVPRRPRACHQFIQEGAEGRNVGVPPGWLRGMRRGKRHVRTHLRMPFTQTRSHAGGVVQRGRQRQDATAHRRGEILAADKLFGPGFGPMERRRTNRFLHLERDKYTFESSRGKFRKVPSFGMEKILGSTGCEASEKP